MAWICSSSHTYLWRIKCAAKRRYVIGGNTPLIVDLNFYLPRDSLPTGSTDSEGCKSRSIMKKAGRESAFHVNQPKMSRYPLFGAEPCLAC